MSAFCDDFTLNSYKKLLVTGLENGFKFLTFGEASAHVKFERACLLRHDVDSEMFAVEAMARAEAELGIRSTYFLMMRSTAYNLFCLESMREVEGLLALGHEIGLHFMEEAYSSAPLSEIAGQVLKEVEIIEREFVTKVSAVSFHQPTRKILNGELQCGDLLNTYNKAQMQDFTYFSDSNMNWRREHPFDVFSQGLFKKVQLLIHPMWWTDRPLGLEEKWRTVLKRNQKVVVDHWMSREATLREIDFGVWPA